MVSSGLLEIGGVNAGEGPLACKDADLIAKLLNLSKALLAFLLGGSDTDEVLEELRTSFLLENKGKLNSTVEEFSNDLDVLFLHVTRGQGGSTDTDATRDLGRCVTRDGVL
jgi:hypothetical protein